jgi:hypothetical protein
MVREAHIRARILNTRLISYHIYIYDTLLVDDFQALGQPTSGAEYETKFSLLADRRNVHAAPEPHPRQEVSVYRTVPQISRKLFNIVVAPGESKVYSEPACEEFPAFGRPSVSPKADPFKNVKLEGMSAQRRFRNGLSFF